MCDITASTVDLAVRGYLRIEERERTGLAGWLRGNTYSFEPLNYHRRPCKVPSAYVGGGIATTAILLLGLAFWGESFQAFYFPLGAVIMAAVLTAVSDHRVRGGWLNCAVSGGVRCENRGLVVIA